MEFLNYLTVLYLWSLLIFSRVTEGIGVNPCYRSKDERTLGLLFGGGWNTNCLHDPAPGVPLPPGSDDYVDPVHSEEDAGDHQQDNQIGSLLNRPENTNSLGGLFSWFPNGFITQDHWPTRPPRPHKPHRPPRPPIVKPPVRPPYRPHNPLFIPSRPQGSWFNQWLSGWLNMPQYPVGNKPGDVHEDTPTYSIRNNTYGVENIKPVYEHVDEDPTTWKPGLIVGGANHNIGPLMQDISNWSTVPPPKPTRPQIPGYNRGFTTSNNSILDLFFKK